METDLNRPEGHPCLEILMRYARRLLSPFLTQQIDDHVRNCRQCKAAIAQNYFKRPLRQAA